MCFLITSNILHYYYIASEVLFDIFPNLLWEWNGHLSHTFSKRYEKISKICMCCVYLYHQYWIYLYMEHIIMELIWKIPWILVKWPLIIDKINVKSSKTAPKGRFGGLNPGPPAPKAGIIPLDQTDVTFTTQTAIHEYSLCSHIL